MKRIGIHLVVIFVLILGMGGCVQQSPSHEAFSWNRVGQQQQLVARQPIELIELVIEQALKPESVQAAQGVMLIHKPYEKGSLIALAKPTGRFEVGEVLLRIDSSHPLPVAHVQVIGDWKFLEERTDAQGDCGVPVLLGDLNIDHVVNFPDFGHFRKAFGSRRGEDDYDPRADLYPSRNAFGDEWSEIWDCVQPDGVINLFDFGVFRRNFGVSRPDLHQTIHFECPVLEGFVREAKGYTGQTTGPIHKGDVLGITVLDPWGYDWEESEGIERLQGKMNRHGIGDMHGFDCFTDRNPSQKRYYWQEEITSLEGIQHLTNLNTLEIRSYRLSDISPLRHLIYLDYLSVSYTQVSDISPLQHLSNLEQLIVRFNFLEDISPLQHLTQLQVLVFCGNPVRDISSLQHLVNLEQLIFGMNLVDDLTFLRNLTNLEVLAFGIPIVYFDENSEEQHVFGGNQVSDIQPLRDLTKLKALVFWGNEVSDITPLVNLANLEMLIFSENQVSDISALDNLVNLGWLAFNGNQVSSIAPLRMMTELHSLAFDENQVEDLSPLQFLPNLQWLNFHSNQVSDISPLVKSPSFYARDYDELYRWIDMRHNYLDLTPGSQTYQDILTLIDRGIDVEYEPQAPQ